MLITLLAYAPFLGIALIAQWSDRRPPARWVTFGLLLLVDGLVGLFGLLALLLSAVPMLEAWETMATGIPSPNWLGFGLALLATALVAPFILLAPVRRGLARLIPIDAESGLHAAALDLAALFVGLTLAQYPLVGGLEGIAASMARMGFLELLIPLLPFGLFAVVGVGFLVRRDWRQTRRRLGLVRLTWRQAALAVGLAITIVVVYYGIDWIWRTLAPENYELVGQVGEVIYGGVTATWQAVLLSLTAGVMEELLFRGAAQPRFGIPLTSVLFAAAHIQYGLTPAIVEILLAALVLGWLRRRHNTSACMLLHFLYDALALLILPMLP